MSDIRYCDSCNKPLEAAAFTRGRAIERENLVVCGTCVRLEAEGYALPISPSGEGKEQFKAFFANLHESEIRQIQEETKPISPKAKEAEVDEAGTEPIEELPSLKVIGADGKALSARLRQNAAGELVLELEGDSPAKAKDTEPTSRVSQANGDVRLPARSSISRAALSKRLEIETQAARSGRGFNMTAAMLFLVVVLSGLGFSIYIAISTQADANQGQQGNQQSQNTNPPAYNTQPPAYNAAASGNEEVRKTPEGNQPVPNKTGKVNEPVEAPLRFPVAIDAKTRERMIDHEKMIASPIIRKLTADDLETRLTGLSDAIREISVECGPFIMPMLRAENPAERQLVCEALGFLMVSDARPALERVKGDAKEKLYVRLAAGRALSRLDLRSHLQDLDGWSTKELEDLQRVLMRKGEKGNSLGIVERALKARRASPSKDEE